MNDRRLDNTLPGRDSFDIEIYGMEGVPPADLADWKARKAAAEMDGTAGSNYRPSKKPRVDKGVIPAEKLHAQLEAHKALMSGKAPPPGVMSALAGMAPPGMLGPPPPLFAGPPPGFPNRPPPVLSGPPPGYPLAYTGPPPGVAPSTPTAAAPAAVAPPQPSPHQRALKTGAKSRMVYTDATLSPEEKLASTGKYAYLDPEDPADAAKIQARKQANALPGWQTRAQIQEADLRTMEAANAGPTAVDVQTETTTNEVVDASAASGKRVKAADLF